MNLITRTIHMALEPLRYNAPAKKRNKHALAGSGAEEKMGLIERLRYRRRVNLAIHELSRLSDDTLKDIGVERGNIPDIVAGLIEVPAGKSTPSYGAERVREHDNCALTGGAAA